jgi:tRNA(Arg) A34 adenosine deaminase TadA
VTALNASPLPFIHIEYPDWVVTAINWDAVYRTDIERMSVAISVARANISAGSGGPFGAAIFEESGRLVSVGMNCVVRCNNSVLHAETMAFMMAQARVGSFTLKHPGLPQHSVYSSCEPCAMCLGATLWSGVRRLVCAATRDDAIAIGFDEGPVFDESYRYLAERGLEVTREVLREEARQVMNDYSAASGEIYNG